MELVTEDKKKLLKELAGNKELLYSLSREDMKRIMKGLRKVKEAKYKRHKIPKYRFPGYKAMTLEDLDKFFSAFLPEEHRFKTLFLTQAFLGLRIGEAVKVNIKDIDFKNKQIRIRTEKNQLYNIVDSMYLHEKLEGTLMDYISLYEVKIMQYEGYLFYSASGKCKFPHFSTDSARNVFRRICTRAGLDQIYGEREPVSDLKNWKQGKLYKYSTHSLRHSFGKFLTKRNVPIELAKHLLRHKDIKSTQIYYVPDKEDIDKTMRTIFSK